MKFSVIWLSFALLITGSIPATAAPGNNPNAFPAGLLSSDSYDSIQTALDQNPGKMIFVPAGDHAIATAISITTDHSGLYGPGRIIQTAPHERIVNIDADYVRLSDLTLTRTEGTSATVSAVYAEHCRNLTLHGLRVVNNRAPANAINLNACAASQVLNCLVQNYGTLAVDDRTPDPNYGYAFLCIDGTGIAQVGGQGILIQGNRVIQNELLPDKESAEKYNLGKFTKKNAERGQLINPDWWAAETVKNFHQGAAIITTGPETADGIQVLENFVLNAAQGIDTHSDHVIAANNITENTCLGIKALHGARNVLIANNIFNKADINGVLMQPGAASHGAGESTRPGQAPEANVDGGSIVAHNITSNFGYGSSNWIWGNERYPYEFNIGQLPGNPALHDVLFLGNFLFDPGRLSAGANPPTPPRYIYAMGLFHDPDGKLKGPENLHAAGNQLHPGTSGAVNQPNAATQ